MTRRLVFFIMAFFVLTVLFGHPPPLAFFLSFAKVIFPHLPPITVLVLHTLNVWHPPDWYILIPHLYWLPYPPPSTREHSRRNARARKYIGSFLWCNLFSTSSRCSIAQLCISRSIFVVHSCNITSVLVGRVLTDYTNPCCNPP